MKIHIVKKGESLFSIAQKYGTTLEEVIQLNPEIANPDKIDVGMKVKVPSSTVKPVESDIMHQHSVKQGDTLWKLSKAWGVPLNEMIKANPQLKNPNALLVGEVVNIPKVTGGTTLPLEGTGIPKWQSMLPNVKVPTMPVAPAVTEKPLTAFQVPAEKPTPAGPPLKPHVDLFKQFNVQATEVMAMPEFPKTPEMPIAAMPHQPMPYGIGPMVLSTPEHWPCPPESPMNIPAGGISAMNMPASGFYPGVPGAPEDLTGSAPMFGTQGSYGYPMTTPNSHTPYVHGFPAPGYDTGGLYAAGWNTGGTGYPMPQMVGPENLGSFGSYGAYGANTPMPGLEMAQTVKHPCSCGCKDKREDVLPADASALEQVQGEPSAPAKKQSGRKTAKKASIRAKKVERNRSSLPWLNR